MNAPGVFPYPLLVADIGGTNARFALSRSPGDQPRLAARLATRAFPTFEELLAKAVAACGAERPRSLALCAAGPVAGRSMRLTNAPLAIDGPEIARAFRLEQGVLLNDFEAAALALAFVEPGEATPIGPEISPGRGPRVVLGPGTGLGVAALVIRDGALQPLPGEGGHVGIGPQDDEDEEFWPRIERIGGRVSAESLLSGPGLARLHAALAPRHAERADASADPPAITRRALSGDCAHSRETAQVFLKHLARFSGDIGLVYGATGGVFIRGGVASALAPLIAPEAFRAQFSDKPTVAAFARTFPLARLRDDAAILRTLAALGARPDRFTLDFASRLWRS
ncbi:MAG: glucokinase [Salinarimonadaceae bacterium]|nr:MAG: glucokinase [Salinarimonadaceae bacterium]